jgi:predicted amidohydrolase
MIVDAWGTVMAGGGDDEVILRTQVDVDKIHQARERFPGLAGRTEWL